MLALLAAAWTATEIITIIGVASTAIISVIAAWRTGQIKKEVTTINGRSLAQLGDAIETRRIGKLPDDEVTAEDVEHVQAAPDPDAVPSVDPAKP